MYDLVNNITFRLGNPIFNVLEDYKIGKTYTLESYDKKPLQCSSGYHFAKEAKYNQYFQNLDIWFVCNTGFYINACLACEIREEDILYIGENKIRAKSFKVLEEVDVYCYGKMQQ